MSKIFKLDLMSLFPLPSFDLLVLQGLRCERGAGVLNFVLSLEVVTWPVLSGQGCLQWNEPPIKIRDRPTFRTVWLLDNQTCEHLQPCLVWVRLCWTGQWFNRLGSTQKRLREGWSWVRVVSIISRHCLSRMDQQVLPGTLPQLLRGEKVSLSVLRPNAAHCVKLVAWLLPRRKPLLKMMHKKDHRQFVEDVNTRYVDWWNNVPLVVGFYMAAGPSRAIASSCRVRGSSFRHLAVMEVTLNYPFEL